VKFKVVINEMAWSSYQIFLALLLVLSGTINTISVKWMDMTKSMGLRKVHTFNHPFVQADLMFLGEIFCLAAFAIAFKVLKSRKNGSEDRHQLTKGSRSFNRLYLLFPAVLDLVATATMYFGLTLTNASSFQMLRGSVIVFVAILSKLYLKRATVKREWYGIGCIIIGLFIVGLADIFNQPEEKTLSEIIFNDQIVNPQDDSLPDSNDMLYGDFLVIIAQLISACQMVYEEVYVTRLDIASLQVVGWEGIFGFTLLSLFLPFYGAIEEDDYKTPSDAFEQIKNSSQILIAAILLVLSIAFYNFSGVSVTKEITATTRMVLDSVRTLLVWIFSLSCGWQQFHFLQVS
jgi:drug/metabolite transporter (DMT)-like permease